MGFTTAVKTCLLGKYVTFSGRATRSEFWFFQLFILLASLMTFILDEALSGGKTPVLQTIFGLAVLIPNLAVGVRRMHDTGRSGWWLLVGLIPLIGGILLIAYLVIKSDATDNQFGPAATPQDLLQPATP